MSRRSMGELEGMYFQWARGRAIVAKRSMALARRAHHVGDQILVNYFAKRARNAIREWRRWRHEMQDSRERGI